MKYRLGPEKMRFDPNTLTSDHFLGGALDILQPAKGYRAGVDPVLLAASVPAIPGQSVLELGCGAGVASLCLGHRVKGLSLSGIEIQPEYSELAVQNAARNNLEMAVYKGDLRVLPKELLNQSFDHIIANPPYFDRAHGTAAPDAGRDIALAGETLMKDWIQVAAKRLKLKGYATFIQDIRRLPELLEAVSARLGSIEILPLAARSERDSHLFLLRARKGGRAAFRLYSPCVMHQGAAHDGDRESYTDQIRSVLRDGAALTFGGR